MATRKLSLNLE